MSRLFILLLPLLLGACQSAQQVPQALTQAVLLRPGELPVPAFAALPQIEQLSLSPNGQFLAFLQNSDGETVLITQNRNGQDAHIVLKSDNEKYRIGSYEWVNDNRLLVRVWYPQREGDLKYLETRLLAANRDGKDVAGDLIRIENNPIEHKNVSQFQDKFTVIPGDDTHVLLALDVRQLGAPDVYKLDVYTGDKERVASNPGFVRSWIYDRQGRVRVGIGVDSSGLKPRIVHRFAPNDDWQTLADDFEPLGFGDNPDDLYGLAEHQGKSAVFKLNLRNPIATPELVYADPNYDVDGKLIYSPDGNRAIGVYYEAESGKLAYWDQAAQNLQRRIDQALPGRTNVMVSSRNGQHVLISSGATFAPVYYWLDGDKNQVSEIVKTYPDLKPSVLVQPQTVHFKARDGLELEAYLTRAARQNGQPGPTIMFPHGGPWSRDSKEFDYWTQFLVNRGWNVLQLNFRGSAGFGENFKKAGFQRWGLEMQDDITDGVQWLIGNKIADPGKICIIGASYGGYAALMGLATTPELYRCGVSFAPVTDLLRLHDDWTDMRWLDRNAKIEYVEKRLGNWWSDRARLKATSPVNLAERIRAPLLLVHGAEDRSVDVAHSQMMAAALQSAGFKELRYLEQENGDHHLSREQDRLQFFQALDAFLKTYQ